MPPQSELANERFAIENYLQTKSRGRPIDDVDAAHTGAVIIRSGSSTKAGLSLFALLLRPLRIEGLCLFAKALLFCRFVSGQREVLLPHLSANRASNA